MDVFWYCHQRPNTHNKLPILGYNGYIIRFDRGVIDLQNLYNTGQTDYSFKNVMIFAEGF